MRNPGVIQVGGRKSEEIRFRSRVRQRHRECRVKIETAPSLARLGTFARLRLAGAASAKQERDRFYFHGKALFSSPGSLHLCVRLTRRQSQRPRPSRLLLTKEEWNEAIES